MAFGQNLSKIDSIENFLEQRSKNSPFDSTNCVLLDTLFESYKHNNFKKAKQICEKALIIGNHLNNNIILAYWNRNLGHLYSNYELYSIALEYYLKGRDYSQKEGITDNWWYINIGNIYYSDKNFTKASQSYHKAIECFSNQMAKDTNDSKTGIAVAYSNLGLIYIENNKCDSALVLLKNSLAIREKFSDNNSKVFNCNLIAQTYIAIDSLTKASEYLDSALYFDKNANNHAFLPNTMLLQAEMFRKQNKPALALKKYYETAEISVRLENKNSQIKSYLQIIELLKEQGDYNTAIKISEKAITLTQAIENKQFRADLYKNTADLYKKKQLLNKAYKYLSDYIVIKDTLELFKLNKLQNSYEIELNKAELNAITHQLKASKQKNSFYRYSITAAFIVLLILSFLLVIISRNTKALKNSFKKINKQNDTINAQYEEISQQNELLGRHKAQLEEMIKEQTIDLVAAKEKAEHADKLKTVFLENLSHEIRTPLNAIVGFSNLMEYEEGLSDKNKKFVAHISEGSNSLLRIIDSIMQVSNMQLGDFKLSLATFNISELINNLLPEFTFSDIYINKRELELKTNIQINQTSIKSDANFLSTILYNLIENAIKYTDKGIVEIGCYEVFKNKKETDASLFLQFYVKDSGIGIAPESLNYIFDKFRKVNNENSKLYRGLGLGLTIVKNMVTQLGGKIWAESEINKGSTFYFTIPFIPPTNNHT